MGKFLRGQKVYFINSGVEIKEAEVLRVAGREYVLKYRSAGEMGAVRLPESRIYAEREIAAHAIREKMEGNSEK